MLVGHCREVPANTFWTSQNGIRIWRNTFKTLLPRTKSFFIRSLVIRHSDLESEEVSSTEIGHVLATTPPCSMRRTSSFLKSRQQFGLTINLVLERRCSPASFRTRLSNWWTELTRLSSARTKTVGSSLRLVCQMVRQRELQIRRVGHVVLLHRSVPVPSADAEVESWPLQE